jgi:hypothetical protein
MPMGTKEQGIRREQRKKRKFDSKQVFSLFEHKIGKNGIRLFEKFEHFMLCSGAEGHVRFV